MEQEDVPQGMTLPDHSQVSQLNGTHKHLPMLCLQHRIINTKFISLLLSIYFANAAVTYH